LALVTAVGRGVEPHPTSGVEIASNGDSAPLWMASDCSLYKRMVRDLMRIAAVRKAQVWSSEVERPDGMLVTTSWLQRPVRDISPLLPEVLLGASSELGWG
jgi:hypothetical protein